MFKEILFGTFVLILVFLLISQAGNAVQIFDVLFQGYNTSVRTLQGRGGTGT